MTTDLDRRLLLKAALVFAAAWKRRDGLRDDAAPRGADAERTSDAEPDQNVDCSRRGVELQVYYGNPQRKAAFFLFLQNVYHIYPEQPFHRLIDEVSLTGRSDRENLSRRLRATRRNQTAAGRHPL